MQVNFCAIREWNLWARTDMTPVTHKVRITDIPYEEMWTAFGPRTTASPSTGRPWPGPGSSDATWPGLCRHPSRRPAMWRTQRCRMPGLPRQYPPRPRGPAPCHVPHLRRSGEIVIEGGKMKVQWNEADAQVPRFSSRRTSITWPGSASTTSAIPGILPPRRKLIRSMPCTEISSGPRGRRRKRRIRSVTLWNYA